MSKIDCSVMSHPACYEPEPAEEAAGDAQAPTAEEDAPTVASYDCINDCVSSLGLPTLVAGALTGLACAAVTAGACAAVIGGGVGAFLGACNEGCRELESK